MSSGRFKLSKTNKDVFTDSITNDLILQTDSSSQQILFGLGCNVNSTISITSNSLSVSNMIGIGTNKPLETLDVRGNAIISNNQYILGNVGIGTSDTLGNKLLVVGDIKTTKTLTASNIYIEGDMTVMGTQTIINTDVGVTDQLIITNTGSDTALKVYQYGTQNTFETYYNDKLTFIVGNNGNVGICTNIPSKTFEVYGESLLNGNTTINCNLNVTKTTTLTETLNCLSNINITGNANYRSNLFIDGYINCYSNVNITSNLYCSTINNIILNYDVPNVIITDTYINTCYIQYTLSNIKQDNDGFGNLIPNIDKLYVTYSNSVLGSNVIYGSNNIRNIKYLNIYSKNNTINYTTTNNIDDTMNIYGLVSGCNYTISLYYQNSRGNSQSNLTMYNVSTTKMGPPSSVKNITFTTNNDNLYINFDIPTYTDSFNNLNISPIKEYYMSYNVLSSIRFSNITHSNNTYISTINNFTISNYKNELYPGTIYDIQIYSQNENINSNSVIASNYLFTGFDSNDFSLGGCNINNLSFADQPNSCYDLNTYYAIDCGSNGPVSSIICSSSNFTRIINNVNSFYKYSTTSNLRLFYTPNPTYNSYITSNVGYIISKLDIVTKTTTNNLENLILNILPFNSNNTNSVNNNKYINLKLTSLNSNYSNTKLDNYFLNSGIEITINHNNKSSNCSYNKYNLNTSITFNNYNWILNSTNSLSATGELEYPPSALNTYNQYQTLSDGYQYKITASSYQGTYYPYKAFDKLLDEPFLTNIATYNYISGTYKSSNKTIVDSIEYSGEWIQIELPYNVLMTFMILKSTSQNSYKDVQPKDFILAGSLDNSTWSLVLSDSISSYSLSETKSFFNKNIKNLKSYKYYRLIILNTIGVAGYSFACIGDLSFYGYADNILFDNNLIITKNITSTPYPNVFLYHNIYTENLYGDINFEYYFDNIKDIGNPTFSNFKYTLIPNNKSYISGITCSSNYTLTYEVTLSNAASYWTVNPIIKLQTFNNSFSNIYREINTSNNYYYYNNSVLTQINKETLTTGLSPYNYKLTFNETDKIIINSNVLYSNLDLYLTGYSLVGSNTSNISIYYLQYDKNSLNHPHITSNNSSNIYGERVFFDSLNITDYPFISSIKSYNHNCNIASSNYSKEAALFGGYYYGNYANNWKQNWNILDNNSFNYSNIISTDIRWCTTYFTNIMGSSTNLQININDNSHDDKLLYIKYYSDQLLFESPWFNGSNNFNGKSLYVNRNNNDGIKDNSKIDTINKKYIKCPPLDYLSVYVSIGIPCSNLNSCFSTINVTT